MCVTMLVSRASPIKFCVVVVVVARFQLITYMSVCNNLCPEVMQCGSHVNTLAKREAATQFAIIRHSASLFAEASNRSYHRHTLTHPRNSTHTHTPSATVYYMTRLCGPIGHRDMFFFRWLFCVRVDVRCFFVGGVAVCFHPCLMCADVCVLLYRLCVHVRKRDTLETPAQRS